MSHSRNMQWPSQNIIDIILFFCRVGGDGETVFVFFWLYYFRLQVEVDSHDWILCHVKEFSTQKTFTSQGRILDESFACLLWGRVFCGEAFDHMSRHLESEVVQLKHKFTRSGSISSLVSLRNIATSCDCLNCSCSWASVDYWYLECWALEYDSSLCSLFIPQHFCLQAV